MLFFIKFIAILYLSETLITQIRTHNQETPYTDWEGRLICKSGDTLKGNLSTYTFIKDLGRGGFSNVVEAEDESHNLKAIKILNNDSIGNNSAKQEIIFLNAIASLKSKHLCKKLESFGDHNHTCIVFEKHGPSLFDFLIRGTKFSLDRIRHILNQLLPAVQLLHDKNIVHCDIGISNILFFNSEYNLKSIIPEDADVILIDFGISNFLSKYTDPENGKKLDVLKMGNAILELLHHDTPFDRFEKNKETYEANLKNALSIIAKKGVEYEVINELLGEMLKFNPRERITLPDVLEHPFVTGHSSQQPNVTGKGTSGRK